MEEVGAAISPPAFGSPLASEGGLRLAELGRCSDGGGWCCYFSPRLRLPPRKRGGLGGRISNTKLSDTFFSDLLKRAFSQIAEIWSRQSTSE